MDLQQAKTARRARGSEVWWRDLEAAAGLFREREREEAEKVWWRNQGCFLWERRRASVGLLDPCLTATGEDESQPIAEEKARGAHEPPGASTHSLPIPRVEEKEGKRKGEHNKMSDIQVWVGYVSIDRAAALQKPAPPLG